MSRKVRVAATSLATFEDVKPPYNLRHPDPQDNMTLGLSLLDAAGSQRADIALLPETFIAAGLPYERGALAKVAETIPGPTFEALASQAQRYGMYVVAGLPLKHGKEHVQNVAVLIDRQGSLVGMYAKQHPTEGEIASGVVPGNKSKVFETDFGRVGLAICFDLNWPAHWAEMARQGAELICWLSAYPGGFPLQAYAWQHQVRIATSVWTYEARIIDFTGRIVAEATRWGRLAIHDLDFEKRLFHTDSQYQHILSIQAKYGPRVEVETFSEEHLFTLQCNDPQLSVDQVIAEFGLIEYRAYIARCTDAQQQHAVAQPSASFPASEA